MKLIIHLLGQARQPAATGRLEVDLPDCASVDAAVRPLLAATGSDPRLAGLLAAPDGTLRRGVMAILRDEVVDPATPGLLRDGDELSLLPPMSGG